MYIFYAFSIIFFVVVVKRRVRCNNNDIIISTTKEIHCLRSFCTLTNGFSLFKCFLLR